MGRHKEMSEQFMRWVWEAYQRLDRGTTGKPRRGELHHLKAETGLTRSQLWGIIMAGRKGKWAQVPVEAV